MGRYSSGYVSNAYGGGSKHHVHKKAKHHGIRGFLGNLVDDVQEAGAGFIPGVVHAVGAVAHDAGHAVGLADGPYQTDDIASAIKHSYTDKGTVWGESGRMIAAILRGDLDAAKQHNTASNHALYENPLSPLLDALTIATAGGAAFGKAGQVVARGALEGTAARTAGARLAGLDAQTLKPLRITVENTTGGSFTKAAKRNPVTRRQGEMFEAFSNARPDGMFGVNKRVGRHAKRLADRTDAHEIATTQRPFRAALAKVRGLDRKAVWILAGEHDLTKLKQTYALRHRMLEGEIARKKVAGRKGEPGDHIVQQDAPELPAPGHDVRELRAGPNHDAGTDMVLWEAPDGTPNLRKPGGDELLAHDEVGHADLSHLKDIDRRESLAKNHRNLAFVQKRLALLHKLDEAGTVANPSPALTRAAQEARTLSDHTNDRLVALSRGKDADIAAEDQMLAQRTADRSTLESRIMRQMGVEVPAYRGAIRSHVAIVKDRLDTHGAKGASKWTNPGDLGEAQHNTGYNFFNARDSTNAAMYLHTAANIYEQTARVTRHAKMLDMGMQMSRREAGPLVHTGRFKVVEASSAMRKDMAEVYSVLVDAEPVMAGTPGYNALLHSLERSTQAVDGSEEMVFVLPTKTYDELASGLERSSEFVRRWIDNPTKVWRALTLNLRPAWIVNGYIGNLFMLANAYGVRGLKNYVLNSSKLTKRGRWADTTAPELTDFGWGGDANADLKGMGQSWRHDPDSRAKRVASRAVTGPVTFSRAMGHLNEWLADAPQRRAALISAIDPHVRRVIKAHPDTTWEEAATKLWHNDEFSDEMTQRVLDDMVDFSDLSPKERTLVKRAIPFYAWVKGATKLGAKTLQDKPWNPAIGSALAEVNNDRLRAQFGGELAPFQLGQTGGAHGRIVMTQALNPFMTPVDMLSMAAGAFLPNGNSGTQNPLAQFNPLFKAPAEALAKRDFFTGANLDPQDQQSLAGLTFQQGENSISQKRLIDAIRNTGQRPSPNRIYDRNPADTVLAYLGAPVRTPHLR